MTISAPSRPPRPGDPVDREYVEDRVQALIEEARRRARRRRRIIAAVVASAALVGVTVFAVFDRVAQSQTGSPASAVQAALTSAAAAARIAFLSDVPNARLPKGIQWQGELYITNIDGSDMRRLARFAAAFTLPAWSPDGRTIAFQRRVGPRGAPPPGNGRCGVCHGEIFVVNADGSGLRNLTGNAGGDVPVWSPDGRTIAFSRDEGGTPALYVMNADGSGQRRVTEDPIHVYGASWSPDGRRLTFASGVPGNPGEFDIYVVNVDGSGQQKLTQAPNLEYAPAWSPDGRTIAYLRTRGTSNRKLGDLAAEIYLMNADGSGQRRLVPVSISDSSFSWSPDGRTIAFVSKRDGNDEVYVVNVDGSGLRNLTRSATRDGHPVWSSDGRTIGFVSNRGGNRDIYVIKTDGSGQRNLTRNLDQKAFGIAWMPTQRS